MNGNADVVLAVIRAVEQRDVKEFFRLNHDDVELHDAVSLPYGGILRGKSELREQLENNPAQTWLGTWGPLQPTEAEREMDPRVVADGGDEVAVLFTQRALSPAGERFESPVMGLYQVRDGQLAKAQMFHYDTAAIVDFLERAGSSAHDRAA